MEIAEQRYSEAGEERFTLLIPTWNNLAFAQLCVSSIREHSHFPHQIVLHINDGSDGTLEWAQKEGLDHTHSVENVGVCHALNAAARLSTTPYICFLNDDMVVLPDWDLPLMREIEQLDHDQWFLSGTMIEPTETGNPCVIAPHNYGGNPAELDRERLHTEFTTLPHQDWTGATWPPNVVPKTLWDAVGGYSLEFSPGMSSDPDFSMKLWQHGVRYFKGIAESRVYHFQAKSTGKVTKNNGSKQFLHKWGITQSTFTRYYIKRGTSWKGPLSEPALSPGLLWGKLKSFFKKLR